MAKIGRNHPCLCGSGKKYKHCHGRLSNTDVSRSTPRIGRLEKIHELGKPAETEAAELLRVQQQGRGKRIESFQHSGQRFVVAGDKIYHSQKWKTFIDFLSDYLLDRFGRAWFKAEWEKSSPPEHPLLQWNLGFRQLQEVRQKGRGEVRNLRLTGAALCYFGLAYGLYLLQHNVELQKRYLDRLRNIGNFQGAYYELIVASVLIQTGFKLELEDETDGDMKHCEFSAISPAGRKYWVEAKMRSVSGVLGKNDADGISPGVRDATTRLTKHLNEALKKPAADERLIFVDLNTPVDPLPNGEPSWMNAAVKRLDARERELRDGEASYVFVTNLPFHRYLNADVVGREVLTYGLGINDFSKPGYRTFIDTYRQKQKHLDAHHILDGLKAYPNLPSTFDGTLPSEAFGGAVPSIRIGESYFFDSIGEVAEVTTATILETEKRMMIGVSTKGGKHLMLSSEVTEAQVADYQRHPDVFFGQVRPTNHHSETPFELFEWMHETYRRSTKETLLKLMGTHPDIKYLR